MNYPGNSGGPVINKPDIVSMPNTASVKKSCLLGIVSSYIIYQDVAISQQTGQPRISFQENSGLANIVPAHILKEWISSIISTPPPVISPT
jgi:hypothetical protein